MRDGRQTDSNQNMIKQNIAKIIEEYKLLFPEEYKALIKQNKEVRDNLKEEFAKVKSDTIQRQLIEWPETLYTMLVQQLTREELNELFRNKDHKTIRWVARSYPELAISNPN